jgi:hypothetical protein
MITEERLQQIVHEAAQPQAPVPGAWNRFEARLRRAKIRRAAILALAASVAAGFAIAIPKLTRDRGAPPVIQPIRPSNHRDPILGYQLGYPPGWQRYGSYGETVFFRPLPMDALGANDPSYLISLRLDVGRDFDSDVRDARDRLAEQPGGTTRESRARIDGRPAVIFTTSRGPKPGLASCDIPGCRTRITIIDWATGRSFRFEMASADNSLIRAYEQQAQSIIESMRPYTAPKGEYVPASGHYPIGMREDALSVAVFRFLDARAAGRGAEGWLSVTASKQYKIGMGPYVEGLRLYAADGWSWTYRVLTRIERPDGTAAFDVSIEEYPYPPTGPTGDGPVERLIVGPRTPASGDDSGPVVLSAERTSSCNEAHPCA